MTNEELGKKLSEIHESLQKHFSRTEYMERVVRKLEASVFGNGKRGLTARVLVLEGGLGLIAVGVAIALTWLIGKL